MMTFLLSLNRVVVFAADLTTAQSFYGQDLGLELVHGDDRALTFRGPNFLLTVFPGDDMPAPDSYSRRPGASVAFTVQSIEAAVSHLSARGVQFLHEAPNSGPIGRYVAFTDPFGTVFELMESI